MRQPADSATPVASIRETLRRSFLAFAVGYCVAFVACIKPDTETCSSGRFCPSGSHCAARQDICIFTPCGNGKLDAGEVCDDGTVVDGDGCNSICTSNEICGNGIKDKKEECDYAATPENCTTRCMSKICGNGEVDDPREECDPGYNGTTRDCLANCKRSEHGDGWVNPLDDNEQCDVDGLGSITPGNHGPACEFAGTVAGTYRVCNSDCTVGYHGDGKVNRSDGEQCDGNSDLVPTGRNDCESRTCNWNCTPGSCRDGVPNQTAGETCDDGNSDNFDDCTNACTTNTCGDMIQQTHGSRVEECDRGSGNVDPSSLPTCRYGQTCPFCLQDACTVTTVVGPYCGDGSVQGGYEQCDTSTSTVLCRTCDGGCYWIQPGRAEGFIDVVSAGSIVAGDRITINDGTSLATLEFSNSSGNCTTTAVSCVYMDGVGGNEGMAATRIRAAMSPARGWTSNVKPSGEEDPVSLVQTFAGAFYNIGITVRGSSVAVSPAESAVVVDGMSGGVGCRRDQACTSRYDCVSGKCTRGICE